MSSDGVQVRLLKRRLRRNQPVLRGAGLGTGTLAIKALR
jgi:hypothetical protein